MPKPDDDALAESAAETGSVWYSCSCHCGATSFKISHEPLESASIEKAAPVAACNCSICLKNGYLLLYVFRTDIEYVCGWEDLRNYRFASKSRDHKFCGVCGTSIGIDFMGSNKKGDIIARIIQGIDITRLNLYPADGRNYQPEYN
ncbi:glutathione-dependent formaldehyde-activating enzyme domain-containing protein [Pochonia chlamydosporia 170]|uniref:Glutathione-dependent formaldehyde-activating enzyme domain-containing protein n=1 Tax=Pochonia chlamydosporia 170 TaxID=1380566 RepID=A0A219AQD0_METCM|nr:glutathione-dependent formaldehyde-activating enzyme domain-containing protein [Pochonia chlamydosporia 170]OWT42792.1 glutathione-dependent formaldehyde-activating enzyme domain-containing protein [Pochonia chlamydosporia 170]